MSEFKERAVAALKNNVAPVNADLLALGIREINALSSRLDTLQTHYDITKGNEQDYIKRWGESERRAIEAERRLDSVRAIVGKWARYSDLEISYADSCMADISELLTAPVVEKPPPDCEILRVDVDLTRMDAEITDVERQEIES